MFTNGDLDNKEKGQQEPQSDERYVILPGHPFYGQCFKVVSRRDHKTYVRCVIENPKQPGFHYHIMERWLSATPPTLPVKPSFVITLEPVALDKMVQMVLAIKQRGRTINDAQDNISTSLTNLESTAHTQPETTSGAALPSGTKTSRRE